MDIVSDKDAKELIEAIIQDSPQAAEGLTALLLVIGRELESGTDKIHFVNLIDKLVALTFTESDYCATALNDYRKKTAKKYSVE